MKAVLKGRRVRAALVADKWKAQYYYSSKGWRATRCTADTGAIHRELTALGDHPDPDDVDRIIGNGTWTQVECDGCGGVVELGVEVGETSDYESRTATLCSACLADALKVLEAE